MIKDDEFMKQTYACRQHRLCKGLVVVEYYLDREDVNILPKVGLEYRGNKWRRGITLTLDFLNVGASVCIMLRRKGK